MTDRFAFRIDERAKEKLASFELGDTFDCVSVNAVDVISKYLDEKSNDVEFEKWLQQNRVIIIQARHKKGE